MLSHTLSKPHLKGELGLSVKITVALFPQERKRFFFFFCLKILKMNYYLIKWAICERGLISVFANRAHVFIQRSTVHNLSSTVACQRYNECAEFPVSWRFLRFCFITVIRSPWSCQNILCFGNFPRRFASILSLKWDGFSLKKV